MLSDARKFAWAGVRGLLPYPDLPRRIRMRRTAFKLITCKRWPGDDATGNDAARPGPEAVARHVAADPAARRRRP
jgi:hypothetical protein